MGGLLSTFCMMIKHLFHKDAHASGSWSDLPADIVITIVEHLHYSDQIRFRAVCKSWRASSANAVKFADKLPWLFAYSTLYRFNNRFSSFCYLYEPCHRQKHTIELKQALLGARVHASQYGWLLFSKQATLSLHYLFMFYSPFTGKIIELPALESMYFHDRILFSASPTSPECVVFVVRTYHPEEFRISTCSPGDRAWTMHLFDGFHGSIDGMAFMDGVLYCSFSQSVLGAFEVATKVWRICQHNPVPRSISSCNRLIESDGKLLMPCYDDVQFRWRVLSFDWSQKKWFEIESLGGKLLFLGCTTSMAVPAVGEASEFANKILSDCFHPSCPQIYPEINECGEYGWLMTNIWIQPPEQI
ncbi:F-box protein [Melia azedarach]|nr:F-box protein [Melia azedarach]